MPFHLDILIAFIAGISCASLSTAIIYRLPRGLKLYGDKKDGTPPHCASCNTPLALRDYIPVLGFALNRGKCRFCKSPIPAVYFWVECLGGIYTALIWVMLGDSEFFLPALLLAITTAVIIAIHHQHNDTIVPIFAFAGYCITIIQLTANIPVNDIFFSGMLGAFAAMGLAQGAKTQALFSQNAYLALGVTLGLSLQLPGLLIAVPIIICITLLCLAHRTQPIHQARIIVYGWALIAWCSLALTMAHITPETIISLIRS